MITAAVRAAYEKLKGRSRGDAWSSVPSADEATRLAMSRLSQHYDVAIEKLTVVQSSVDTESQRYELAFVHEDGRKFGATVGALAEMPSCTRVWSEATTPMPRPLPTPPDAGH